MTQRLTDDDVIAVYLAWNATPGASHADLIQASIAAYEAKRAPAAAPVPMTERAEVVEAWNNLPDELRCHPGLKALWRSLGGRLDARSTAQQEAPAEPAMYCERCGVGRQEHERADWCDNQSFAATEARAEAQRIND